MYVPNTLPGFLPAFIMLPSFRSPAHSAAFFPQSSPNVKFVRCSVDQTGARDLIFLFFALITVTVDWSLT